jgi:hypothetical protein
MHRNSASFGHQLSCVEIDSSEKKGEKLKYASHTGLVPNQILYLDILETIRSGGINGTRTVSLIVTPLIQTDKY